MKFRKVVFVDGIFFSNSLAGFPSKGYGEMLIRMIMKDGEYKKMNDYIEIDEELVKKRALWIWENGGRYGWKRKNCKFEDCGYLIRVEDYFLSYPEENLEYFDSKIYNIMSISEMIIKGILE